MLCKKEREDSLAGRGCTWRANCVAHGVRGSRVSEGEKTSDIQRHKS